MPFEDFFQAEILLRSGVEPVYSLLNLIHFHMNALRRDINYHLIGILSLLNLLETPISLAVDYSKYPRIVAGRTSNWHVYPPFSRHHRQNNTALPRLSWQLHRLIAENYGILFIVISDVVFLGWININLTVYVLG